MQTENFFQHVPRVLSALKYKQWFLVLQVAAHVEWKTMTNDLTRN
jgi:hypothetical protein